MNICRLASSFFAATALACASLATQAQDVYWSVGWSAPGVQLGVSNALPVLVQPRYQPIYQPRYAPVVEYASPYWRQPAVRMVPPPVVYFSEPEVYAAPLQYAGVQWRGPGRSWQSRHRVERLETGGRHRNHHDARD